jgi:hypothetical protein
MYMTHRMRPIFTTKFAGYTITLLLKKEEGQRMAFLGISSALAVL